MCSSSSNIIQRRSCIVSFLSNLSLILKFKSELFFLRNLASAASRAQRTPKPSRSTKHCHIRTSNSPCQRGSSCERSLRGKFSSHRDNSANGAANYATNAHAFIAASSAEANGKHGKHHGNALAWI